VTEIYALIEISNQMLEDMRLRSRRPSLRKTGRAVAINEMLTRRSVAEWLRRGPVAGCEMRVADEEQFDLCARLVEPAQLGKACRQETA
jgi:hypothetical protein